VPAKYRYQSSVEAVELLRKCAVATERPAIDLSRYSWDAIGPVWLDRIREMTGT